MNCRDFIKEFEERNPLTEPATLHLNDCADCRKTNALQTQVWQAIDGFKPVAAPNDFNFRVKARIAKSKPGDFQPGFSPVLRYVLPLGLFGLIFAFVLFNGVYSLDDESVQVAAGNSQPAKKEILPPNSSAAESAVAVIEPLKVEQTIAGNPKAPLSEDKTVLRNYEGDTRFIAAKPANAVKKSAVKSVKEDDKNSGGSQLNALRPLPKVFTPKGIPSNPAVENQSNFERVTSITPEQILSELGIESAAENGRRQVKKIKPNSVAERSGVRVGDVIEAIDGEKLTSEPIRAKTVEGKKLTVARGTEKIEILLSN